jgi:hypothetical protein
MHGAQIIIEIGFGAVTAGRSTKFGYSTYFLLHLI